MTSATARLAHLMTRRIAIAAVIVTLAGAAAGAAALAVMHPSAPAPAAGRLTASTAAQTPSSAAGAKGGHHHRSVLALAVIRATASETGLSLQTIRKDLRAGQTLDQIAGSKAAAVEHDVLAALQARLDKAVDAGKITKAQEAARLARAKTRIEALMSTPRGAHPAKPSTPG